MSETQQKVRRFRPEPDLANEQFELMENGQVFYMRRHASSETKIKLLDSVKRGAMVEITDEAEQK